MAYCPCIIDNLNLWEEILVQKGIEEGWYEEVRTTSSVENQDVYELDISGKGEDYIDPSNSFIFVEFVIKKANNSVTANTNKVAVVNNALHSIFQQVDVWFNEHLITKNNNLYPYKAYFEDLLSHGVEAQNSYLTAQGFFKEESGKFEDESDTSFSHRQGITVGGKKFQVMGRLHVDMFQQNKLILNDVDIKIKLVRSSNAFCLLVPSSSDAEAYKLKITDIAFYVRKVRLSDDVKLDHIKKLEKEPASYPYKRVEIKSITIPSGQGDINLEKLYDGAIPNKLFCSLVPNASFNGNIHKNPFKFDHHSVNFVALYIDGKQIPADPYTPDYTDNKYCRPYLSLIEATGTLFSQYGCNIKYEEWKTNYNIYGFDLTPHLSEGNAITKKRGNVRAYLKFGTDLSAATSLISYAEFDEVLKIDKGRNILPFLE